MPQLDDVTKKSKEIQAAISQQTGIKEKDLDSKTAQEVEKVVVGAKKVAADGGDPLAVDVKTLKETATGEPDKSSPQDLSKQEKIVTALAAILPTLAGYAIGGNRGGAIAADATQKGLAGYYTAKQGEADRATVAAREAAKSKKDDERYADEKSYKERGAKLEEEKFGYSKDKDKADRGLQREKMSHDKSLQDAKNKMDATKDQMDRETKLRDSYLGNAQTKEMQISATGIQQIREAATSKNPSGFKDMALIFAFMKTLDPGSTVREGEYATAQKNAGILERFGINLEKVNSGQQLSAKQRADLMAAAEDQFMARDKAFQPLREDFGKVADQYGVDRSRVLMNFGSNQQADGNQPPNQPKADGGGNPMLPKANAAPFQSRITGKESDEELDAYLNQLRSSVGGQ